MPLLPVSFRLLKEEHDRIREAHAQDKTVAAYQAAIKEFRRKHAVALRLCSREQLRQLFFE